MRIAVNRSASGRLVSTYANKVDYRSRETSVRMYEQSLREYRERYARLLHDAQAQQEKRMREYLLEFAEVTRNPDYSFSDEFSKSRDAWERNLISDSEYFEAIRAESINHQVGFVADAIQSVIEADANPITVSAQEREYARQIELQARFERSSFERDYAQHMSGFATNFSNESDILKYADMHRAAKHACWQHEQQAIDLDLEYKNEFTKYVDSRRKALEEEKFLDQARDSKFDNDHHSIDLDLLEPGSLDPIIEAQDDDLDIAQRADLTERDLDGFTVRSFHDRIEYSNSDAGPSLTDVGLRVDINRFDDEEARRAAVLLAHEKFGDRLSFGGPEENQRLLAKTAFDMGLGACVYNPELQDYIKDLEAQRLEREAAERELDAREHPALQAPCLEIDEQTMEPTLPDHALHRDPSAPEAALNSNEPDVTLASALKQDAGLDQEQADLQVETEQNLTAEPEFNGPVTQSLNTERDLDNLDNLDKPEMAEMTQANSQAAKPDMSKEAQTPEFKWGPNNEPILDFETTPEMPAPMQIPLRGAATNMDKTHHEQEWFNDEYVWGENGELVLGKQGIVSKNREPLEPVPSALQEPDQKPIQEFKWGPDGEPVLENQPRHTEDRHIPTGGWSRLENLESQWMAQVGAIDKTERKAEAQHEIDSSLMRVDPPAPDQTQPPSPPPTRELSARQAAMLAQSQARVQEADRIQIEKEQQEREQMRRFSQFDRT